MDALYVLFTSAVKVLSSLRSLIKSPTRRCGDTPARAKQSFMPSYALQDLQGIRLGMSCFFEIVALSFTLKPFTLLAAGRVDVSFELCDHGSALQLEGANPRKAEVAVSSGSCLFCSSCLFFDAALELASAPALNTSKHIKTLALTVCENIYIYTYTFKFKQTHMSHVLNVLHKCLRHCLRFTFARTGFAYAHILSYVELTLAYANHSFAWATPLQARAS